jgi:DNA-directed RNA polymerase specialized sigma24 family protein
MHRFDHLSYSEIAGVLDISVNTVEAHMVRNLKYLRKVLSQL